MSIYFIGLSTSGHDPSIAIADELGKVFFAESTERYLQDKRAWGALPDQTLHLSGVIDNIIQQDAQAEFQLASSWSKDKTKAFVTSDSQFVSNDVIDWMRSMHEEVQTFSGRNIRFIGKDRVRKDIWKFDHHLCHAVNAVYSSPFSEAACLVLDGEGEVGAASLFQFSEGEMNRVWRSWGPGSLGAFYTWATELCGFSAVAGEEWKVMGLAAYGKSNPIWVRKLTSLMTIENGRIEWRDRKTIDQVIGYFKKHIQNPSLDNPEIADLAASAQVAFSEYARKIIDDIYALKPQENLIYTGGCALNSSFNGTINEHSKFRNIHIPSAPADDGNAIGAAILAWQKYRRANMQKFCLPYGNTSTFLGSMPAPSAISKLEQFAGPYLIKKSDTAGIKEIANLLQQGKIVGVMRGKAEFGPRSLGHRSILANPATQGMKDKINQLVKGRESYRPFAPVVPIEQLCNWFENPQNSPYMSFTLRWKENKKPLVPAVVHADGTGRVQSVSADNQPWLYDLVHAFSELTNIPVLLNTSFNVMGKPIIHTVNDAVSMLQTSGLDALLIEDTLVLKEALNC